MAESYGTADHAVLAQRGAPRHKSLLDDIRSTPRAVWIGLAIGIIALIIGYYTWKNSQNPQSATGTPVDSGVGVTPALPAQTTALPALPGLGDAIPAVPINPASWGDAGGSGVSGGNGGSGGSTSTTTSGGSFIGTFVKNAMNRAKQAGNAVTGGGSKNVGGGTNSKNVAPMFSAPQPFAPGRTVGTPLTFTRPTAATNPIARRARAF